MLDGAEEEAEGAAPEIGDVDTNRGAWGRHVAGDRNVVEACHGHFVRYRDPGLGERRERAAPSSARRRGCRS